MTQTTRGGDIAGQVRALAEGARAASRILAVAPSGVRNAVLQRMADGLLAHKGTIQAENGRDLAAAEANGLKASMVDRLRLSDRVLSQMADGLREVAALPDPVGEVTGMWRRPNGLQVGRMRIPLGVVAVIYESRPNVTADTAGLCVKSGNAVFLRGGSEALHSNRAVAEVLRAALGEESLPEDCVTIMPTPDRQAVTEMIQLESLIDVVVPRGGEGLIRFISENSRVPVIKHYKGICHVYVDAAADIDMAVDIAVNAKAQRPGVCNAMETLLVHVDAAESFFAAAATRFADAGVEVRGCERTVELLSDAPGVVKPAEDDDWDAEFLDLRLAVRVVADMDAAIAHIRRHGSQHTESIVTADITQAQRFVDAVDSSAVMVNASTRFNDGFQLGLGAEMGISTSKLHCFGPMGLVDLTTTKYVVYGQGQIREH